MRRRRTHRGTSAAVNIHVRDLAQMFNSLDPSPFWDRDLDRTAAEFIEEEFSDKPLAEAWNLYVHTHEGGTSPADLQAALETYYGRMASSAHRALRDHLWSGQWTLIGGVGIFLASMGLRTALGRLFGTLPQLLDEGLIILAWLALWRPAEMLIYGWVPLRRKERLYERLAGIHVSVRPDTPAHAAPAPGSVATRATTSTILPFGHPPVSDSAARPTSAGSSPV